MGILYYFIACIPMIIISIILNHIIDKFKIGEKIEKFDKSNSGPIYDFIKTIFYIFMIAFFILSISIIFLPIYISNAFIDGNYIQSLIMTLIGSIILAIYCNISDFF